MTTFPLLAMGPPLNKLAFYRDLFFIEENYTKTEEKIVGAFAIEKDKDNRDTKKYY
jgi:hypothetical protein